MRKKILQLYLEKFPVCLTVSISDFCPQNGICSLQRTLNNQVFISFNYCIVVVTVSKKILRKNTEISLNFPQENINSPRKWESQTGSCLQMEFIYLERKLYHFPGCLVGPQSQHIITQINRDILELVTTVNLIISFQHSRSGYHGYSSYIISTF